MKKGSGKGTPQAGNCVGQGVREGEQKDWCGWNEGVFTEGNGVGRLKKARSWSCECHTKSLGFASATRGGCCRNLRAAKVQVNLGAVTSVLEGLERGEGASRRFEAWRGQAAIPEYRRK